MRCPVPGCPRQTFREQVPGVLDRYQRRTRRLTGQVSAVARELAGRAGTRLLPALGILVSRHTALRALLQIPLPALAVPRVLGIDDFALRRGLVYATVLIDAETGRRVDVVPGRTADAAEDWLRGHPGVEVVCRDGSGAYGEAVRRALPGAVQVSDRWHLWHGLGEAVRKEVAAHSACWAGMAPLQAGKRAETTLERWQQVHDLLGKGIGLLECARRLDLALNTVKRYARAERPERLQRTPQYRPTLVDPYRDHLRRRRAEDPAVPVQQLLREIRELGYQGSSNLLVRYINQGRVEGDRPHLSPRRAARLLLTRPAGLTARQHETLAGITAACTEMTALAGLISSFAALLTPDPGNVGLLAQWITATRAADLPTSTPSPAGSTWTSRPPPRRSRCRITTAAPRESTPGPDAQTTDVRTRRIRPPPPHPPRLRLRTVTTERATEPLKLQSPLPASASSSEAVQAAVSTVFRVVG